MANGCEGLCCNCIMRHPQNARSPSFKSEGSKSKATAISLVSDGPQIRSIQLFVVIFPVPGSNNAIKQLLRMQPKTYQSGALSKSLGQAAAKTKQS